MQKIVFDADMLLYIACDRAEKVIEWEEDFFTLHCDLKEATALFDEHVEELLKLVIDHWHIEGEYQIIMCLSDDTNFRKDIFPDYKANRNHKRRPVCFKAMRKWIHENYNTLQLKNLEADDAVGITCGTTGIAISGDKDFLSLPCRFYDFSRNEFHDTTIEEADSFHRYQTLIGDATDNYKGCPRIGEVRARRILDEEDTWEQVVRTYEANGSSEEEALLNARLAFILREGYYDMKKGTVKLWTPYEKQSSGKTEIETF